MKKFSAICLSALIAVTMFVGCSKNKVVINNVKDLDGKKIGVQAGTTGELYVLESVQDAKLISFKIQEKLCKS